MKFIEYFGQRALVIFAAAFILTYIFLLIFKGKMKHDRKFLISLFVAYLATMSFIMFMPQKYLMAKGLSDKEGEVTFQSAAERLRMEDLGINLKPGHTIGSFWKHAPFMNMFFNVFGNILIFVPVGFFLIKLIKDKKVIRTLLFIILMSFTIEFIQFFIGRSVDIDDLILNVAGGAIGMCLGKLIR